jgi:hypothetical protein
MSSFDAMVADGVLQEGSPMFMQSDDKRHSLGNNLWAPLELAAAVAVILSVLASQYMW